MKNSGVLSLVFLLLFAATVTAQSTAFTYQGRLEKSGNAANGNYDFELALFDSLAGGTQLGSTLTKSNVPVANGVFSVSLDFGNQFSGASRFLEIRLREAGIGGFVTLAPRQAVNSTPYAVKSLNAESASSATTASNSLALNGVAANQYVMTGDSRLSDARNPLPNSTSYIQNQNAGPQAESNFNISGSGSAGSLNVATQFNIGGSRILSNPGQDNLFAGVDAGFSNIEGAFNAFFGKAAGGSNNGNSNSYFGHRAGSFNSTGSENSFFGKDAGQGFLATGSRNSYFGADAGGSLTTGNDNSSFGRRAGQFTNSGSANSFFGLDAGRSNTSGSNNTIIGGSADVGSNALSNATAIGHRAFVTQSNSLVLGSINGVNNATANTNIGIGTTSPSERLHVVGNGLFTGNLTVSGTLSGTLPAGSSNYIHNFSGLGTQPSSNFSISGTGSANVLNAGHYRIGGLAVMGASLFDNGLSIGFGAGALNSGSNNTFVGNSAGSNNSGDENAYFGANAEPAVGAADRNSFFGAFTSGSGLISNSTAIGNRAFVGQSNSLVLGSINGINGANADTNVGIGTTAPARRLHVSSGPSGATSLSSSDFVIEDDASAFQHFLTPDDNESGILFGDPTDSIGGGIIFNNAATNNGIFFRSGGNITRMTLTGAGNLGIGTAIPADMLDVNGDIRVGSGTTGCVKDSDGTVLTGACSSDLRFKKSVSSFSSVLRNFTKLQPVNFFWRSDEFKDKHFGTRQSYGLIAQDVEDAFPDLVTTDDQGYKLVNYSKLPLLTIQAVKEQQAQIEEQKRENAKLRSEISDLKLYICGKDPTAPFCKSN